MSERLIVLITVGTLAALGLSFWIWLDFATAPPHRFELELDQAALGASLTLNGETIRMQGGPTSFRGSRDLADASGEIQVRFADGEIVHCPIGYVTNGEREPHAFQVFARKCFGHVE
jgi:hypothetical protein